MLEYIVSLESESIYSEKNSLFKALSVPALNIVDIKSIHNKLKNNYSDANHICYAYRMKINNRLDEFSTDGGEPKGSAGIPILNTLKRKNLVNTVIFVMRYFGGTKLGISGLINAYGKASSMTIEKNILHPWILKSKLLINYKYEIHNRVNYIFKEYKINILKTEFKILIKAKIEVESSKVDIFINELFQISNGDLEIQIL
tara:strand:+ start:95 stop:697 length:603 start_codon:yes stop_codon:yes gene_type:complete